MSASREPCGEFADCAWRVAKQYQKAGRRYQAEDLCLGIGGGGEPCGKLASAHFGSHEFEDGTWHRGQPFCEKHAAQVLLGVIEELNRVTTDKGALALIETKRCTLLKIVPTTQTLNEAERKRKQAERRRKLGVVYFARRGMLVKIGTSTDPAVRIRGLQTQGGYTFDDVVLTDGGRAQERRYHRRYQEHRTKGEWFTAVPEIRAEMDRLREI